MLITTFHVENNHRDDRQLILVVFVYSRHNIGKCGQLVEHWKRFYFVSAKLKGTTKLQKAKPKAIQPQFLLVSPILTVWLSKCAYLVLDFSQIDILDFAQITRGRRHTLPLLTT